MAETKTVRWTRPIPMPTCEACHDDTPATVRVNEEIHLHDGDIVTVTSWRQYPPLCDTHAAALVEEVR